MSTVATLLSHKGHDILTIDCEATVADAVVMLAGHDVGALIVTRSRHMSDASDVVGILSERDVVRSAAAGGRLHDTVGDAASSELLWATPDTSLADLAAAMVAERIRHMPVRDGATPVGVVSIGDVVAWHLRELEATAAALSDYVTTGRG